MYTCIDRHTYNDNLILFKHINYNDNIYCSLFKGQCEATTTLTNDSNTEKMGRKIKDRKGSSLKTSDSRQ